MRDGKRFLYIHHDVRRIIRVDGKGGITGAMHCLGLVFFEHWNLILDEHV